MSARLARLNAIKQNIISFVLKLKEPRLSTNTVRISKANKVVDSRHRAVNTVGDIIRTAVLIGLPIVYNTAAHQTPLPKSSSYEMAEEANLQVFLENADQLFDQNNFQDVVDVLKKYQDQNEPTVQWRLARALFSLSKTVKDKHEKEKYIVQSFDLIKSSIEADPTDFASHKWMAIIADAAAELQGIKARILQLDKIKFHMHEAVRLNPKDPTTWHMMGAYEYGLAELSWIQRKLVSTIFASPPTGSFEKALEHFEKAETLKEGFYSTNWLMIGKCHIALKNIEQAKSYLEKAANCAVLNEDDKKCKEEAVSLLRKL